MEFLWDDNLATGNQIIDRQHKQLIEALGRLSDAIKSENYEDELFRALEFLSAYTVKHFQDEEQLQIQSNYSDYLRHRQYHSEFRRLVAELTQRLSNEGPSEKLVEEVVDIMGNWLVNHIKGDDFCLAAFLSTQK